MNDLRADRLAEEVETADDVEAALWRLWGLVVDRAITAPQDHGVLVELVVALRGRPVAGTVWELELWSDLPVLGAQLREAWSWAAPPARVDASWERLNAFVARLAVAGVDVALLGLWTLRAAFEEPDATDQDRAAAAVWFATAGDLVRAWSAYRLAVGDPDGRAARPGPLLASHAGVGSGFGPERLAFWEAAQGT